MTFFDDIMPKRFLDTRVQDLGLLPPLTGLCASYDGGQWRDGEFADYGDGRCPARTGDLLLVRQALYQLS
jgi:hypothetical protein